MIDKMIIEELAQLISGLIDYVIAAVCHSGL